MLENSYYSFNLLWLECHNLGQRRKMCSNWNEETLSS